jgi:hypothetical protein
MPAVDVINLASNENDAKKDFSLAFIGAYDRETRTWCTVMTIAIEQPLETFAMYYALSMPFQKIILDI